MNPRKLTDVERRKIAEAAEGASRAIGADPQNLERQLLACAEGEAPVDQDDEDRALYFVSGATAAQFAEGVHSLARCGCTVEEFRQGCNAIGEALRQDTAHRRRTVN